MISKLILFCKKKMTLKSFQHEYTLLTTLKVFIYIFIIQGVFVYGTLNLGFSREFK